MTLAPSSAFFAREKRATSTCRGAAAGGNTPDRSQGIRLSAAQIVVLSLVALLAFASMGALQPPVASAMLTSGPAGHVLSGSLQVVGNISAVEATSGTSYDLLALVKQLSADLALVKQQLAERGTVWASPISPTGNSRVYSSAAVFYPNPNLGSFTVPATGTWMLFAVHRSWGAGAGVMTIRLALQPGGVGSWQELQAAYVTFDNGNESDKTVPLSWTGVLTAGDVLQLQFKTDAANLSLSFPSIDDGNGHSTFTAVRVK